MINIHNLLPSQNNFVPLRQEIKTDIVKESHDHYKASTTLWGVFPVVTFRVHLPYESADLFSKGMAHFVTIASLRNQLTASFAHFE